jgi:hypothetical protein
MDNRSHDRAEEVALFRFSVISEAVSPSLTPIERGLIVRAWRRVPGPPPRASSGPFARVTIDRWVAAYRRDGLAGLRPTPPRADRGGPAPRAGGSKKRPGCAGRCRRARQPRSLTPSPGPMGWCSPSARCGPICAGRD